MKNRDAVAVMELAALGLRSVWDRERSWKRLCDLNRRERDAALDRAANLEGELRVANRIITNLRLKREA